MKTRLVGKVKDAHGLKGELYFLVFSGDCSWLKKLDFVYLKKNAEDSDFQKFELEKAKPFKEGFIGKLKQINDRNASEDLKSQLFYVNESLFESQKGETIFLSEVLNFVVVTDPEGEIGSVSGFSTNGAQDLLLLEYQGKKVEIPFVSEFIKSIDFQNQKIYMNLPPGLLNLDDL